MVYLFLFYSVNIRVFSLAPCVIRVKCCVGFGSGRSDIPGNKKTGRGSSPAGCLCSLVMKEPLEFAHFLFVLILASDDDVLELLLTGTGRNEMTADDILLETFEVIDTGSDGRLAENLGCLLE